MIVLVTGGRGYNNREVVAQAVHAHMKKGDVLLQGGATGADSLARHAALRTGFPVVTMDANWDYHGKSAGPIRNIDMKNLAVAAGCRVVLVFKGGKGTAHMKEICENAGLRVVQVYDR